MCLMLDWFNDQYLDVDALKSMCIHLKYKIIFNTKGISK